MKVKKNPKVSIIIPTYNREKFLIEAIESAFKQTYNNVEIIVSDNGSTDNTKQVCKQFLKYKNFKYYKQQKKITFGPHFRKLVFNYTTGDFCFPLFDDDYLIDNEYIQKAIDVFNQNKDVVLVHSNYKLYYTSMNKFVTPNRKFPKIGSGEDYFFNKYVDQAGVSSCGIMFDMLKLKEIDKKIWNISDCKIFIVDILILYALYFAGKVAYIDQPTFVYRMHKKNASLILSLKERLECFQILEYTYPIVSKIVKDKKKVDKWFNTLNISIILGTLVAQIINSDESISKKFLKEISFLKKVNIYYFNWKLILALFTIYFRIGFLFRYFIKLKQKFR